MTSQGRDDPADLQAVLRAVLEDPAGQRGALPTLLGVLDDGDPERRLRASMGVCLVAEAAPEMVEPLTWRLVDRLATGAENLQTRHALAYLRRRHPGRVRDTLTRIADAAAAREDRERHVEISRGFARSDYFARSEGNPDVGRTHPAAADGVNPRHVYREEGEAVGGPPVERDAAGGSPDDDVAERIADLVGEGDESETGEAGRPSEARRRQRREAALERAAAAVDLDQIARRSAFDALQLVALPRTARYSTVLRTRAVKGNTEAGIALHLLDLPGGDGDESGSGNGSGDAAAFADDIAPRLDDWRAISDHEFVVTLYDWGQHPRLWVATEYTDETLYDRMDMGLDDALRNGLRIAETVAYAHQRGVVHAGIDPYNVAYAGTTFEEVPRPLLNNVGVLDVVRTYFEPAAKLDPRYAAPEYFARKYGTVDHATDLYHVGAVLYKLVTGRAPYDGEYESVRAGVLSARPPTPSDVNPEIPTGVDEVVRKAMAKQKLTRYESATQLARDLGRVVGDAA